MLAGAIRLENIVFGLKLRKLEASEHHKPQPLSGAPLSPPTQQREIQAKSCFVERSRIGV
jgi:hypothetical protein